MGIPGKRPWVLLHRIDRSNHGDLLMVHALSMMCRAAGCEVGVAFPWPAARQIAGTAIRRVPWNPEVPDRILGASRLRNSGLARNSGWVRWKWNRRMLCGLVAVIEVAGFRYGEYWGPRKAEKAAEAPFVTGDFGSRWPELSPPHH